MSFGPITSVQIQGVKLEAVTDFLFLVSRITAVGDCSHEIRRQLLLGKKAMTNLNSVLKSKDITLLKKVLIIKATVFPVHVWLWDLDCKEGRVPKNWCLQTVLLEKTLESLLDRKEIKPVNLKVNQPWILIGRTDAKGEAPIFWSPNNEQPTHWKDSDAGKDREEGEEGARGWDGWMAPLSNRHELEQAPRDDEGQESLECCSPWGHEELYTTGWLNNNKYSL